MADTVEMQDIRGMDVDKVAKGFAERQYVFKKDCQVSSMKGDSIVWFSKTAGTLSATAPSKTSNISPLSRPAFLEPSWTRHTSYPQKHFVEGFISMEDIKSADLDVLATTIRDLTRVITRDEDAHIWDVMTESQSPSEIQSYSITNEWDDYSNANVVLDLMSVKKMISDYDYEPEGASLYLSPTDYKNLVTWLISEKGSSIPEFSSEKIKSGVVMNLLGLNVKVSNNVTNDYALVVVPKRATTYKEFTRITAKVVKEEGIGSRIRVWSSGVAYNTDPKAIVLLTNTQS